MIKQDFNLPLLNEKIDRDGFAVVPFLDESIVDELKSFYYAQEHMQALGTHVTMFNPDRAYREKIDNKIKSLCASLAEKMMPGYRVLYTNFMIKEAGPEGYFPVHQDWTYVDESQFSSYAFWIPLQDVDQDNGALHVVRGSHKFITQFRGPYVHEPFQNLGTLIKTKYAEPVQLKAGEVLIWDHRLIHFSLPNITSQRRLAFTLIMVPEKAQVIHCFGIDKNQEQTIEKYEVDTDFYLRNDIGKKPSGVKLLEYVAQPPAYFSEEIFDRNINGSAQRESYYKNRSLQTARYYDEWQQRYNDVYGDIIQAFRPSDADGLMEHIAHSIGIAPSDQILDAGCGVCGPAIWLAERFDISISALTISDVQVRQAKSKIDEKALSDQIDVRKGDYHELSSIFYEATFDKVLFLESLGHAAEPARVIKEVYQVLKPGGSVYIKDFYYKEPDDEYQKARIQKTISAINKLYSYNTLNLNNTISALRVVGFEIDFIRRFSFQDDISIRYEFESRFGIDIFDGGPEFYPAEWLEIKCLKPLV